MHCTLVPTLNDPHQVGVDRAVKSTKDLKATSSNLVKKL